VDDGPVVLAERGMLAVSDEVWTRGGDRAAGRCRCGGARCRGQRRVGCVAAAGSWSPDHTQFRIERYDIHGGDLAIVGYGGNPVTKAVLRNASVDSP
jgi:hypothetical protein